MTTDEIRLILPPNSRKFKTEGGDNENQTEPWEKHAERFVWASSPSLCHRTTAIDQANPRTTYVIEGKSVAEVAGILNLSEQSIRNYVGVFILKGLDSLVYKRPPGRPPKLTKTQRKELAELIDAGPEQAG